VLLEQIVGGLQLEIGDAFAHRAQARMLMPQRDLAHAERTLQ
jgi:hypothetical protein